MKIDFNQVVTNIENEPILIDQSMVLSADGQPIIENGMPKMAGGKEMTLGLACATALQNNYRDEPQLSPDKKLFRFMLALKVYNQSTVEVTIEELAEMKLVLNKQYGTLVYARTSKMLEGNVEIKP